MAKSNSVEKSRSMISEFKMGEKITVNESGVVDIDKDLFKEIVLDPIGVTVDQFNKIEQGKVDFLAGTVLCVGEQLPKIFKDNTDLAEVGFNYKLGKHTQMAANWRKIEDQPIRTVTSIETVVKSAEMNRVCRHLDQLFADVNN